MECFAHKQVLSHAGLIQKQVFTAATALCVQVLESGCRLFTAPNRPTPFSIYPRASSSRHPPSHLPGYVDLFTYSRTNSFTLLCINFHLTKVFQTAGYSYPRLLISHKKVARPFHFLTAILRAYVKHGMLGTNPHRGGKKVDNPLAIYSL